jgi:hypothetical protein
MAPLNHDLNDEQPVCISVIGSTLTVSPNTVPISIQLKQRVHWFLSGEGLIDSIKFKKDHPEPFRSDHNVPGSHRHVLSDIVVKQQHAGKHFPYTVVVTLPSGQTISLDPDVEVMPYPLAPSKRK